MKIFMKHKWKDRFGHLEKPFFFALRRSLCTKFIHKQDKKSIPHARKAIRILGMALNSNGQRELVQF